jgi:hypothetical protein
MTRGAATLAAALAVVVLTPAPAAATTLLPGPYLMVGDKVVASLASFGVSSKTCGRVPPTPCAIGDGVFPGRVPISQRVRVPFAGVVGVGLGPGTDSVSITYGRSARQPVVIFDPLQPIFWPVPGSGTYYMFIDIASHDDRTTSWIRYAVPLYAPRS